MTICEQYWGYIFISDGDNNSWMVKYDRHGRYVSSAGHRGTEPSQMNTPHSIQNDRRGNFTKEFGSVHEIACRKDNQLLVGEITNWRVQKLLLRPSQGTN